MEPNHLDQPIPVTNVDDKKEKKKKASQDESRPGAALRAAAPLSHPETSDLGFIDLDLAEYAPWPRDMGGILPSSPIRRTTTNHGLHHHQSSTSFSSNKPTQQPSAEAVERTETRRYLLKESRTNARLLISVTMRYVPATDPVPGSSSTSTLSHWAVPKIQ